MQYSVISCIVQYSTSSTIVHYSILYSTVLHPLQYSSPSCSVYSIVLSPVRHNTSPCTVHWTLLFSDDDAPRTPAPRGARGFWESRTSSATAPTRNPKHTPDLVMDLPQGALASRCSDMLSTAVMLLLHGFCILTLTFQPSIVSPVAVPLSPGQSQWLCPRMMRKLTPLRASSHKTES